MRTKEEIKEFNKKTKQIKEDIVECFEFLENNRDKNAEFLENYFNKTDRVPLEFDGENFDFNPDKGAYLLSTLSFDNDGNTLRCVRDVEDTDIFDINNYGEEDTFNHNDVKEFFNIKAERFNDVQEAVSITKKTLRYPLFKRVEILEAVHKYMNDKYGAGYDMTCIDIAKKLVESHEVVDLAYTELGDENQFPVQVSYDLNKNQYKYDIAGYDVTEMARMLEPDNITIDDFIQDMNWCDFGDMIHEYYDILEKIYGENWEKANLDSVDIQGKINQYIQENTPGADLDINFGNKNNSAKITIHYKNDSYIVDVPRADNKIDLINQIRKQADEINCPRSVYYKIHNIADDMYKALDKNYESPKHDPVESNKGVVGVMGPGVSGPKR